VRGGDAWTKSGKVFLKGGTGQGDAAWPQCNGGFGAETKDWEDENRLTPTKEGGEGMKGREKT